MVYTWSNEYWGMPPPVKVFEKPQCSAKVTAWCAHSSQEI